MAQQVEYPKIPGTTPENFEPIIKSLLGYIVRESPDDKDLRRYLRSRSLYDEATAVCLFDFLGIVIKKGAATTLNTFGRKLYDTDESEKWQDSLFTELARRNQILVKFVFDALFERLYSVNEMYRGVTSYAYPGIYITLPNFQNWMQWIQATGMVKYIGIRWGPSDKAKAMISYFDGIDIEEVLEEEREQTERGEGKAESEDSEAESEATETPAVEGAMSAAPSVKAAEPASAKAQASTPAGAEPARAASAGVPVQPVQPGMSMSPSPVEERAQFATYQTTLTLRSVAEIREVQKVLDLDPAGAELARRIIDMDDAEIGHNLEGLRSLWTTATDKTILGFSQFGLDPEEYGKEVRKKTRKAFFLYRALVAATCAFRPTAILGVGMGPPLSPVKRFEMLDKSGALQQHFEKKSSVDAVITGLVEAGHAERMDVLALSPYLILARQALIDGEEWVAAQEQAEHMSVLWEAVVQQLHAGVFTLELVWLVREMSRIGLWTVPDLNEIGVVPTQEALDIAFRIGLVPIPYIGNVTSLLYQSRILTGFCPESSGLEAGIQYFGRQLGCAYECPHRAACGYFCREKLRR